MIRSRIGVTFIATVLLSQVSFSQGISIWGAGQESCGRWTSLRGDENADEVLKQWILGFLSGSNWRTRDQQAKPPDTDAVIAFVDRYCKNNPLHRILQAGVALIQESGGPKAAHEWIR